MARAFGFAQRVAGASNTDALAYATTTTSFLEASLAVLAISGGLTGGGGVVPNSLTGGTLPDLPWTLQASVNMNSSAAANLLIYTAPVFQAASGTMRIGYPTTMGNFSYSLAMIANADLDNPVRQKIEYPFVTANSTNFPSPVLPPGGSMVFAAMIQNVNTAPTAVSGFTIASSGVSTTTTPVVRLVTQYDLADPTNTVSFGTSGSSNKAMAAIEINTMPHVGWGTPLNWP